MQKRTKVRESKPWRALCIERNSQLNYYQVFSLNIHLCQNLPVLRACTILQFFPGHLSCPKGLVLLKYALYRTIRS